MGCNSHPSSGTVGSKAYSDLPYSFNCCKCWIIFFNNPQDISRKASHLSYRPLESHFQMSSKSYPFLACSHPYWQAAHQQTVQNAPRSSVRLPGAHFASSDMFWWPSASRGLKMSLWTRGPSMLGMVFPARRFVWRVWGCLWLSPPSGMLLFHPLWEENRGRKTRKENPPTQVGAKKTCCHLGDMRNSIES